MPLASSRGKRARRLDIRGRRLKRYNERATGFISSIEFDAPIARHVLRIGTAHMLSLAKSGQVDRKIATGCLRFLIRTSPKVATDEVAEDIHQLIEQRAVDELGVETAGFLNLGKSRNDQVACALRMELRDRIIELIVALSSLQESLIGVIKRHGELLLPGYTHLQHAQPVTMAHHFFAYFDALQRDHDRLAELYERVNLSPMGAAALAGTSVNLDRVVLASLLGFRGVVDNAMDAVSSRDFAVEALSVAELIMLDMSRMAEEIILWSTKEFGFVEVADEYAASSSIMPQKKNPVTAEAIRAKCGTVLGSLQAACAILKALPYSYNLDLQEVTPHLWDGLVNTSHSVEIMDSTISTLEFHPEAMKASMRNDYSTATSLANHLVGSFGLSFREAHSIVGELVRRSVEEGIPFVDSIRYLPKVSKRDIKITPNQAEQILNPSKSLRAIVTTGGANPRFIAGGIAKRLRLLKKNRAHAAKLKADLVTAERLLLKSANSFLKGVRS